MFTDAELLIMTWVENCWSRSSDVTVEISDFDWNFWFQF